MEDSFPKTTSKLQEKEEGKEKEKEVRVSVKVNSFLYWSNKWNLVRIVVEKSINKEL